MYNVFWYAICGVQFIFNVFWQHEIRYLNIIYFSGRVDGHCPHESSWCELSGQSDVANEIIKRGAHLTLIPCTCTIVRKRNQYVLCQPV